MAVIVLTNYTDVGRCYTYLREKFSNFLYILLYVENIESKKTA